METKNKIIVSEKMEEDRKKILDFAIQKFLKGGFYKTSMDQIASEMHISKKTIYKYFATKEDLVKEVAHEFLKRNETALHENINAGRNAIEKLSNMMNYIGNVLMRISQKMLTDFQLHMPEIWIEIDEFRTKKMTSFFSKIISQGKREGYIKNENTELILTVFIFSIRGVVNPAFAISSKIPMNEILQTTITILLEGILTPKGKRIFNKLKNGANK